MTSSCLKSLATHWNFTPRSGRRTVTAKHVTRHPAGHYLRANRAALGRVRLQVIAVFASEGIHVSQKRMRWALNQLEPAEVAKRGNWMNYRCARAARLVAA